MTNEPIILSHEEHVNLIMMTSQQNADACPALWQSRRDLTPEERMEILFGDVLRSDLLSWDEYQADVRTVGEIMEAS